MVLEDFFVFRGMIRRMEVMIRSVSVISAKSACVSRTTPASPDISLVNKPPASTAPIAESVPKINK